MRDHPVLLCRISAVGSSARPGCRRASIGAAASSSTTTTRETPNTQPAIFDCVDSQIVFEGRGLVTGSETGIGEEGNHIDNIFLGREGYMALDVSGFTIWRREKRELASGWNSRSR